MNLTSFHWNDREIIDQSTAILFDQRCAGLGALIGPHFHHRKPEVIPPINDDFLFPHLQLLREQGIKEPFSHGIARYVPWKIEELTTTSVRATLSSKSEWKKVPLSKLEGQDFTMYFTAEITILGLEIDLAIVSEQDSVVGFHYYYALGKKGPSMVESKVQNQYCDQGKWKPIPETFGFTSPDLKFPIDQAADYGFLPLKNTAQITLNQPDYRLDLLYTSASAEHSWQLYHPKGASFVCIEPLSACDPRKPQLTVSGLRLTLSVQEIVSTTGLAQSHMQHQPA